MRFRSASIAGVDHTPPPDGPHSCLPAAVLVVGCGVSAMVYTFQITFPVDASSALTLPRNVQHSYVGMTAVPSSIDDTGTNTRPLLTATPPVMIASWCVSTFVFQRIAPVATSSAYAFAFASPKYSVRVAPVPA